MTPGEIPALDGKVALVTGANSGIGFATARTLAQAGARTYLLCRDLERGQQALGAIRAEGDAHLISCDLSDPDAITDAAQRFRAAEDALDILVNNAGVYSPSRIETRDGLELTFATNHMGAFRLTHHLLGALQAAEHARIVNLSSRSHAEGRLDLSDLQRSRRWYHAYLAYSDSKLCNVLFTRELARRLSGTGIVANCVHPGTVATGFAQDEVSVLTHLFRFARPGMLTPEQGADSVLWLAAHPDAAALRGEYVIRRRARQPTRAGRDAATAAALWAASLTLAGPLPSTLPAP